MRRADPGRGSQFPTIHFTDVPAEWRERLLAELKTRPEFRQAWDAKSHGAGVTLSLTMPEPVECTYDGYHVHAFSWMGEIYVIGENNTGNDRPMSAS